MGRSPPGKTEVMGSSATAGCCVGGFDVDALLLWR
jgi:hypothetical protein